VIETALFFFEAVFQVADGLIHAIAYPLKIREGRAENEAEQSTGIAMIKLQLGGSQ
jgi:hypothetical protein